MIMVSVSRDTHLKFEHVSLRCRDINFGLISSGVERQMTKLSRVVNKHESACLHSALTRRGTKLYRTIGKDNNTITLSMRYSEYVNKREREREEGGGGGGGNKPCRE